MFCRNCGKEIDEETTFCNECGVRQNPDIPLQQEATPVQASPQPQYIQPVIYVTQQPAKKHAARNTFLLILAFIVGYGVFQPMMKGFFEAANSSPMAEQTTVFFTKSDFISSCKEVTYDEICRYPDMHKGDRIKITGEISQYLSKGVFAEEAFSLYEDYDIGMDTFLKKRWYVRFSQPTTGAKILEDDIVVFYGTFTGLDELKTVIGAKEQIPVLDGEYFEIVPKTASELTSKA